MKSLESSRADHTAAGDPSEFPAWTVQSLRSVPPRLTWSSCRCSASGATSRSS